jgi:hypothetical protein
MNKEFIPYEQALALRELRFDEPCFVFWTNTPKYKGDNIQLCVTDGSHGYSPNSISFKQDFLREGEVLAPTFSQAFRWFREKYGIYGYPFSQSSQTNYWFKYFIQQDWKEQITSDSFSTSEEAELECLKKLIEIVKTK